MKTRHFVHLLWVPALLALVACSETSPAPEPAEAPAEPQLVEEPATDTSTDPRQSVLYAPGLFCDEDTSEAQLQALQGAGFTTINLFALRIGENGDLRTCNRPAVDVDGNIDPGINPKLGEYVDKLRAQGVQAVVQTIGAGGPPTPVDYIRAQKLLSTSEGTTTLTKTLQAWATFARIDGFDFDDEEPGPEEGGQVEPATIASLAAIVAPMGKQNIVTAAPYGTPSETFWLEALAKIEADNGSQLMTWWNLQIYGGADASSWITTMKNYSEPIGISDIDNFFVAGYSATDSDPGSVCTDIQALDVGGGMIWNMGLIESGSSSFADYSSNIRSGLAKTCS